MLIPVHVLCTCTLVQEISIEVISILKSNKYMECTYYNLQSVDVTKWTRSVINPIKKCLYSCYVNELQLCFSTSSFIFHIQNFPDKTAVTF